MKKEGTLSVSEGVISTPERMAREQLQLVPQDTTVSYFGNPFNTNPFDRLKAKGQWHNVRPEQQPKVEPSPVHDLGVGALSMFLPLLWAKIAPAFTAAPWFLLATAAAYGLSWGHFLRIGELEKKRETSFVRGMAKTFFYVSLYGFFALYVTPALIPPLTLWFGLGLVATFLGGMAVGVRGFIKE